MMYPIILQKWKSTQLMVNKNRLLFIEKAQQGLFLQIEKKFEKNIALKQRLEEIPISKKTQPSAREILVKNLGYRGLEVLQNAESQFPSETKIVVEKLGELLYSGEISEEIDGGKL